MASKQEKSQEYSKAFQYAKTAYFSSLPYCAEKKREWVKQIEKMTPNIGLGEEWLNAMIYKFEKLDRGEQRTEKQWQEIFPRYPIDSEGFALSFSPEEAKKYCQTLNEYGLVVVRVLDEKTCQTTICAILEEVNKMPASSQKKRDISLDPGSWSDHNWPEGFKFLLPRRAFHQQAFQNRTHKNIYKVFSEIWQETRLRTSIDYWGIVRGTTDLNMGEVNGEPYFENHPEWSEHLPPHWDYNPWLFLDEMERGINPGYQGLLCLQDDIPGMSGHVTLPGGAKFLKQWCQENPCPKKLGHKRMSYRPEPKNPILNHLQELLLRKGDLLIWSWGQLHGSTPNHSSKMRFVQYLRMFPAKEVNPFYEKFDRHAPQKVLEKHAEEYEFDFAGFDDRAQKLLGFLPWD